MSDYGLIVKNDSGNIQIDSTYKNFTVHDSGTKSDTSTKPEIYFTSTSDPPIFALRPVSNRGINASRLIKDASDDYAGMVLQVFPSPILIQYSIDWLVFTEEPKNNIPDYGLVVKNNSGDVVFSSGETYFKIKSINSISFGWNSYQDVTGLDVDNNYFVLQPFSLQRITDVTSGLPCISRISSSTVRVVGATTGPSGYYYSGVLIEIGV